MASLNVNGKSHQVDVEPDTPLLYVLRDTLGLHGPKFGCGLAQCGSCTVLIDGKAVRSCVHPLSKVGPGKVVTLEGLGTPQKPSPVQQAFIDEQAAQCGYCINGMVMQATAFLAGRKNSPSDPEIRQALQNNLCRCGTHQRIIAAVKRAATLMGKGA
jgi:nicotinate dehydrogenase subunit A